MGGEGDKAVPGQVQEQVKRKESRKEDTQRRGPDNGIQVMTSQTQAAKRQGLPCPPNTLRKQGREVAAPSATTRFQQSRTLWSRDLEVPEKPQHGAILSVSTDPFQPLAARGGASHRRPGLQMCLLTDA